MNHSPSGLLIVNADDWGCTAADTDPITACFDRGSITSTTAMVWMRDSRRAAERALERGLPVGLHVTLDLPYTAADVPEGARRDQADVCRAFAGGRAGARGLVPLGRLHRLITATINAQLEEFERLYERPPTHLDGHHHALEATPAAFLALPPGMKMRNPRMPARSALGRLRRNWQRPLLRRRFATTDRFGELVDLHPRLGGSGIEAALAWADHGSLELMVHAQFADQLAVLQSKEWLGLLEGRPLGSFDDLSGAPRGRSPGDDS